MRTVVVTRPAQQAQPWINALKECGHQVMHVPLLQIKAAGDEALIKKAWDDIAQWAWVMFVSPNAVQYFFEHAKGQGWPVHVRVGSPGDGTSQALIEAGVLAALIDQPDEGREKDTECLWQNIQHRNWQSGKVLLVRGQSQRPSRDWLMQQLQDAGAQVQPLVVYERQSGIFPNELQDWVLSSQARHACWIFSSAESLDPLIGHDWTHATAIVIHPRIAKAVRDAGFGQVICIQPDLAALVDSVEAVV